MHPKVDYLIAVQQGNVPGYSMVHKFGRNNVAASGSWELVSLLSSSASFRTTPSTVRIKAGGHAQDTATGLGAREITVIGLDNNLAEISETIVTSGASASSATTASFWRVYRAYVSAVGFYGATNASAITIEDSGGGADINIIGNGNGQTQHAAYSIPTGKTGYLLSVHLTANSVMASDFRLFTRENLTNISVPMSPKRLRIFWDGVSDSVSYKPYAPEFSMEEGTDIWVEVKSLGPGAAQVTASFEILLIDNLSAHIRIM